MSEHLVSRHCRYKYSLSEIYHNPDALVSLSISLISTGLRSFGSHVTTRTSRIHTWPTTYGKTMVWTSQKVSFRTSFPIWVCPARSLIRLITHNVLEHENAYVRASTAAGLAEALIEYWPASISKALSTLQDFYREKVCPIYHYKRSYSAETYFRRRCLRPSSTNTYVYAPFTRECCSFPIYRECSLHLALGGQIRGLHVWHFRARSSCLPPRSPLTMSSRSSSSSSKTKHSVTAILTYGKECSVVDPL